MSPRRIAFFAIGISSFLWATAGVTAKILLRDFEPFPLAFWRFFFASIALTPIFIRLKIFNSKFLREVLPVAILSTGNITFFYLGLTRTTANASAIIYTGTPLLAAILSKYTIKENLPGRKLWGILLGLLGVLVISILPMLERGQQLSGDTFGNFLTFIASCSWAGYTVGSRHLITRKNYSPLSITAISILVSTAVFFALSIVLAKQNFITPLFNPINAILIAHISLLVTVATYLMHQWAIKYSSATTATLTNYTSTIIGVILGITILGEPFTTGFAIGTFVVFAGIFLYTGNLSKEILQKLRSYIR